MGTRRRPAWLPSGHLGSSVSALLDGQLDPHETERAWQHVATCPPCRRLVEHEGWVKRQLASMAGPRTGAPPDRLVGSLLDLDPTALAWAETDDLVARGRARGRVVVALVGAGSVSAAVLGLGTLSGLAPGSRSTPATSIGNATPTRAVLEAPAAARGRLPGWAVAPAADGVMRARLVGERP